MMGYKEARQLTQGEKRIQNTEHSLFTGLQNALYFLYLAIVVLVSAWLGNSSYNFAKTCLLQSTDESQVVYKSITSWDLLFALPPRHTDYCCLLLQNVLNVTKVLYCSSKIPNFNIWNPLKHTFACCCHVFELQW
jgi:hypothetical protein